MAAVSGYVCIFMVFGGKKCSAIFYGVGVGYLGQTSTAHVVRTAHESKA